MKPWKAARFRISFTYFYGLVKAGDLPVAIVPAFSMNVPMELVAPPWIMPYLRALGRFFPRLLVQPTLFVGSPCSDEGSIGIVKGVELSEFGPRPYKEQWRSRRRSSMYR